MSKKTNKSDISGHPFWLYITQQTYMWLNKDRLPYSMTNMTLEHLRNSLAKLEREKILEPSPYDESQLKMFHDARKRKMKEFENAIKLLENTIRSDAKSSSITYGELSLSSYNIQYTDLPYPE